MGGTDAGLMYSQTIRSTEHSTRLMKLQRLLLPFLFLGFASVAASAQVGIYGDFDYTHYTDHSANASTSFYGGGVGVYDDFLHVGPLRAGLDLRGDFLGGNNYRYRDVLAGVRVAAKAPVLPFKPYGQFSVGVGGPRSTGALGAGISGSHYTTKFTYEVMGGVDCTILPHVDFRVLELGYGRMTGVDGSAVSNPASTLFSVRSGLVFRL